MPLPDLILAALDQVRSRFYHDKPPRLYHRDEPALLKAIARYGYACAKRGWLFDSPAIQADLLALLRSVARSKADPSYLPAYLEAAVDSHVRTRAEELSARAKLLAPKLSRIVSTTQPVTVIVRQADSEVLAALYRDLAARKRARRRPTRPIASQQPELL